MFKDDLNSLVDPDWPKAPTPLQPAADRAAIESVRAKSGEVSSAPSAGDEIGDEVFQEQSRQTLNYTVTAEDDPTTFFIVEAVTQLVMVEEGGRLVTLNFEPPDNAE